MTSLTFYREVNEIGGNKILLQDKGTNLVGVEYKITA